MTDSLKIHPEWKNAVSEFLARNPKPGDIVTRPELEDWFSMKRPASGTFEAIQEFNLRFLSFRDRWAEELMRKHQIQLGEKDTKLDGWPVLAPNEVASFTARQSTKELKKALRKQRDRLAFTDLSELTPAEQLEHAETLVRSSWKLRALKDADKKPIEFPAPPKALPRNSA